MSERVAVVTGASRGIGRATALALGHAGFAVAVVARSAPALEETRLLVEQTGTTGGRRGCRRDGPARGGAHGGGDRAATQARSPSS